jgi:menaquinone-dependent protoporphyrinogen oxidase
MTRIVVAYATRHGSTAEVADAIADELRSGGFAVDVAPVADVHDVSAYDGVVVGGSLYTGRWHRDALRFLRVHADELREREVPVAVFAMGPQTLEADAVAGSRRQLDSALSKVPALEPRLVAIFGGVVDPAKLRFPFNRMHASDARDWDAIGEWAQRFGREVRGEAQLVASSA